MKAKQLLQSRKFWASLFGLAVAIGSTFGIELAQEKLNALLTAVSVIVGAYSIGTGIEAGLSGEKNMPFEIPKHMPGFQNTPSENGNMLTRDGIRSRSKSDHA
ncbi:MAG: hypothetical protein KDE54_00485 [Caldilineaceae bacterium]|nr:hypothetical protein [Caldilineaceae bacterium]MCB0143832.1 hypothetical protein [Caldilineaceae bacterium]